MPVIIVATVTPLPGHRDEVGTGKIAGGLDVVYLQPAPAGDLAKGAL